MITEDYVSFEIAKLLKENGFDAECDYLYADGELIRARGGACNWNSGETIFADYYKNECSAPTLQMAMKWLRKAHNIDIIINVSSKDESDDKRKYTYAIVSKRFVGTDNVKRTYEEACEAALKYCLENLVRYED
jgi:hypothetical protein